jgi:DNA gyrase subunit B
MTEVVVQPSYGGNDISVLEGLDAVRKRPGMYIGSTDSKGLNHLVWEIIDNSVDEALGGHATRIDVTLGADGSVTVEDDGRGIPTSMNDKTGLSGAELSLTKLHAGGKFGGNGYKSAGGLHGVGSSVVNALSIRMDAIIYQHGKEHKLSFQRGKTGIFAGDTPDSKFKEESGLRSGPDKRTPAEKKIRKTGTTIRWWHDAAIFLKDAKLEIDSILKRARTTAFLVAGLTIAVHDNRDPENATSETFFFEGGIVDMVDNIATDQPVSPTIFVDTNREFTETVPVVTDHGTTMEDVTRDVEIKIAFRWGNGYDYNLGSYVNVVNTPNGGSHVRGFERSILKIVNEQARAKRVLKAADEDVIIKDVVEGLTAVVTVGFPEPQFEGQTKGALGTSAITKLVMSSIDEVFGKWIADKKNAAEAKLVLEKIANAADIRKKQMMQKDTARRKTALSSSSMPAKLVDCSETGTEGTELLIAEGDSALGTLKQARSSRWQSLLPIRGKILNTLKATSADIYANKEVAAIIQVMGAGSGRDFDLEKLRVSRVIIAADADVDGAHIQCLLITMFNKVAKPLIEDGRLFVAVPPLYTIKTKGKNSETIYAVDDLAKEKILIDLDKKKTGYEIARLKGLGEMDAQEFWDTTLNPEARTLKRITMKDVEFSDKILELSMGKEVAPRKEWIMTNRHVVDDTLL